MSIKPMAGLKIFPRPINFGGKCMHIMMHIVTF